MATKLGKVLTEAREKAGVERGALAKEIGITASYLGLIERGAPAHVSDKLLNRIKVELRITANLEKERESANKANRKYESDLKAKREAKAVEAAPVPKKSSKKKADQTGGAA